jgi:hypothetical protein
MKNFTKMMAAAALGLTVGNARADLGDSTQVSARKYTPLPHDTSFDVVGSDGLLHSTDDIWHYYSDNSGHVIGHIYDTHGIAVAVEYAARSGEFTWNDVTYFVKLNGLSCAKGYWNPIPDLDVYANWVSKDGNYYVSIRCGNVEHKQRLYAITIWTAQAYNSIVNKNNN